MAGLHPGGTRFVATYLPGRRVVGVRVDEDRVLLSVVLAQGASVCRLEKQVRDAVAPLVAGRAIDVHVADVDTGEELSAASARTRPGSEGDPRPGGPSGRSGPTRSTAADDGS